MNVARSSKVAFGLYAATQALRAKLGQTRRGDGRRLLERHAQMVPDDWPSAFAAADFVAGLADDPAAAGDAFLTFLADWPFDAPTPTGQIEATLGAAAGEFAASGWHDRKDCGHG